MLTGNYRLIPEKSYHTKKTKVSSIIDKHLRSMIDEILENSHSYDDAIKVISKTRFQTVKYQEPIRNALIDIIKDRALNQNIEGDRHEI